MPEWAVIAALVLMLVIVFAGAIAIEINRTGR